MKTKIGEIKSITDFFEDTGERKEYNYSADKDPCFKQEDMLWKCKLCKEKFWLPSGMGMMQYSIGINPCIDPLKSHIELHKKVKELDLDL